MPEGPGPSTHFWLSRQQLYCVVEPDVTQPLPPHTLQERKDGLMRDLSVPTRQRLADLGTVRQRSNSRPAAMTDLERAEDELSSGEVPPLRAQYGSATMQNWQSGESDGSLVARGSGGSQPQQHGSAELAPLPLRNWEGLTARQTSVVRFATHARSASGTQYPLSR